MSDRRAARSSRTVRFEMRPDVKGLVLRVWSMMMSGQHTMRRAARHGKMPRRGFTLIEILIVVTILAIVATIVIPQFSNASMTARENMLKDELRYLRTQIIVYKAQHHDVAPGYPGGNMAQSPTETDFVNQMTSHTDEKGAVSASSSDVYKFGPYLSKMPENPMNKLSAVLIVGDADAWPTADGKTYGWFYRPMTGDIMANSEGADSTGTLFTSY